MISSGIVSHCLAACVGQIQHVCVCVFNLFSPPVFGAGMVSRPARPSPLVQPPSSSDRGGSFE